MGSVIHLMLSMYPPLLSQDERDAMFVIVRPRSFFGSPHCHSSLPLHCFHSLLAFTRTGRQYLEMKVPQKNERLIPQNQLLVTLVHPGLPFLFYLLEGEHNQQKHLSTTTLGKMSFIFFDSPVSLIPYIWIFSFPLLIFLCVFFFLLRSDVNLNGL